MAEEGDEEKINTEAKERTGGSSQYDFYEPIEQAYKWNSARLLEMIMGEC